MKHLTTIIGLIWSFAAQVGTDLRLQRTVFETVY
jgi:hypothetical protein